MLLILLRTPFHGELRKRVFGSDDGQRKIDESVGHDERILDFNKKLIELLYNERYNNFGWKGIIEDKKENGETIEIPPPALPPSYSEATAIQRKRPSSSVEELIPSKQAKQAKQANPETLLALRKYLNEKKLGRQPLN